MEWEGVCRHGKRTIVTGDDTRRTGKGDGSGSTAKVCISSARPPGSKKDLGNKYSFKQDDKENWGWGAKSAKTASRLPSQRRIQREAHDQAKSRRLGQPKHERKGHSKARMDQPAAAGGSGDR